ncbi:hypothetical protein MLD38_029155 [Melastoma candidum]|uniref:Uncharacterized protein n=1 Tax=Melastoma candidum TaxID=119954 RepID=A0ACB9N7A6_9MYRT|nr:hypothetical protein MLD38_029155 [Melastoma candidum]
MDLQGLSSICAGLGAVEESEDGSRVGYTKGAYCLDNLKDLLRFLRRDDPQSREVFKQVCKWNIVSKDLIPIIEHCQEDRHLVLNAVKVLVFLTMPIDPMSSDVPLQIEYLWGLKSAVTSSDAVAVVVSLLESPLEGLESDAFTEDDWKMMQLILTLFRNLLSVQEISTFQKTSGSALQILSLRDRFTELLFRENVMDIFLVVVQHVDRSAFLSEDNVLLLEIFSYIFNGQDPELVAKAHSKGLKDFSAKTSITSLESIIEEENDKRRLSHHRLVGHRHSQFCGTFARFTMDGSKAILKGNPKSEAGNLAMKPGKISRGQNKKIPWDHGTLPSLNDRILKSLHDFLTQFLAGGYNVLMQSIREDIGKEHPNIQAIDVLRFFELAKFATAFQYQKPSISESIAEANNSVCSNNIGDDIKFKGEICGPISATMNEPMFLMVISKWRDAFDGLKQTNDYQFLSAAGSLMKAMFRILNLILKLLPEDSRESQTARILLYKLFYDQTDKGMTQFLLSLMKSFDAHKQPRSDLADLVEIMCTIVRLMERLQDRGALRVSRKSRKGKKKKEQGEKVETTEESSMVGIRNQEDSCDQSTPGNQLLPNDCTLTRIAEGGDLGSLDTDKLQHADMSARKEFNAEAEVNQPSLEKFDHPNNASDRTSDSSGDEQMVGHSEVDFKLPNLLSTFANSSVIHNLCWLLSFYQSNSTSTNKCIISILRTITDDLGLAPMLYQLSLLTTFYEILAEQKASPQEQYSEIVIFLTRLIRSLLRKMKHQPLLFVDILFWKTRRECHHINADYLLHEVGNLRRESAYLGEKSSKGEVDTMPSTGWVRRSIADALGDDEADVVLSHDLPSQNNEEELPEATSISHGQMDAAVTLEGERRHAKGKDESGTKRRRRLVLSHELETKIKDLYEKFKEDDNCYQHISEALDPDGKVSRTQVLNKLKQLGVEVPRKKRRQTNMVPTFGESHLAEGGNHDEMGGVSVGKSQRTRKRVHALNKFEEAEVKLLFEKFKNHRRCSYMIANAMTGDRTFTAAQVTRQLKQLGLQRQNKSKVGMNMAEDYPGQQSEIEMQDSDDETLLSMRLKTKGKAKGMPDSELQSQFIHGELSNDSDEEFLSSALKKSRKHLSKSTVEIPNIGELTTTSTDKNLSVRISEDLDIEDGLERDVQNPPFDAKTTVSPLNISRSTEAEEIDDFDSQISSQSRHSDNLLEDSDGGDPSYALARSSQKGKGRVVLDLDDDDF